MWSKMKKVYYHLEILGQLKNLSFLIGRKRLVNTNLQTNKKTKLTFENSKKTEKII